MGITYLTDTVPRGYVLVDGNEDKGGEFPIQLPQTPELSPVPIRVNQGGMADGRGRQRSGKWEIQHGPGPEQALDSQIAALKRTQKTANVCKKVQMSH